MTKYFSFITSAFLFLVSIQTVSAFTYKTGEKLILDANQEFDESIIATAQTLTIDSNINGDLYCVGQDITINGQVAGDVICAGQSIKINGQVDGNLRLAGQNLTLSGKIGYSATLLGQSVSQDSLSSIGGDLLYGAQDLQLDGVVGRDAFGGSQNLKISPNANIGRNIEHFTDESGKIDVDDTAITGVFTPHITTTTIPNEPQKQGDTFGSTVMSALFSFISTSILVLTLLYFFSHQTEAVSHLLIAHPIKSLFVGLAVLISGPIAAILSMISVVGTIFGVVLLLFYVISIIFSFSYLSITTGKLLKKNLKVFHNTHYLNALAGCAILAIIMHLPFVGGIATFLTILVGLGAAFLSYLPAEK